MMPAKITIIETPNGLAKECSDCHEVKLLHFFVKDSRRPEGRGQPCAECKSKYDIARRKGEPTVHEAKKLAKKKAKVAAKPAKKPATTTAQQFDAARRRGGATTAAKVDAGKANTHPQPQTPAQKSSLLYAKAGRALRESWKHVDPDRYEREMDRLTDQYPTTDATEHKHKLFHAYCEGVINRYGG